MSNNGFKFTKSNLLKADHIIKKYPKGKEKSAILPLLDLAQRQNDNWISKDVIEYIADILRISYIKVYEVVSFYNMFNLNPVGKYHIKICRTTPCWLRGSDIVTDVCKKKLNIEIGETTKDGLFTLSETECLGGCVNSPVIQVNDEYYENLNKSLIEKLILNLKENNKN